MEEEGREVKRQIDCFGVDRQRGRERGEKKEEEEEKRKEREERERETSRRDTHAALCLYSLNFYRNRGQPADNQTV